MRADVSQIQQEDQNKSCNLIVPRSGDATVSKMVSQTAIIASTPKSASKSGFMSTHHALTAFSLSALIALGFYTIWVQPFASGLNDLTEDARAGIASLRSFTGTAFDNYLSVFPAFFMPLAERHDDSGYLFWVWMIPQYGILWAMVMMEHLRVGFGAGNVYVTTALVGLLLQHLGLGFIVPASLLFATFSPLSRLAGHNALYPAIPVASRHLAILPFSILLGYFAPAVAFMLPAPLISISQRHLYTILWSLFPIWTTLIQGGLHRFLTWAEKASRGGNPAPEKLKSEEAKTVRYLLDAKTVYVLALGVCLISHFNVMLIVALPEKYQALLPFGQFKGVNFASVFLPSWPGMDARVINHAVGVKRILQWNLYLSSASLIIYWSNLVRNAVAKPAATERVAQVDGCVTNGEKGQGNLMERILSFWIKMQTYTAVGGPVAALVMGMWERDQAVVDELVEEARMWQSSEKMLKSQ